MPNPDPANARGARSVRHWALVVWPAFLAACLLEALVFAVVDPGELHWLGRSLQLPYQGVYTVAFFCFWLIAMACSALVLWLASTEPKVSGIPGD